MSGQELMQRFTATHRSVNAAAAAPAAGAAVPTPHAGGVGSVGSGPEPSLPGEPAEAVAVEEGGPPPKRARMAGGAGRAGRVEDAQQGDQRQQVQQQAATEIRSSQRVTRLQHKTQVPGLKHFLSKVFKPNMQTLMGENAIRNNAARIRGGQS
jgi:hypothetical protein